MKAVIDKILRGAKPGDIPVEQPTRLRQRDQSQDRQDTRPHDPAVPLLRGDEVIP
jgi:hypothetical protein